MGMVSNSRIAAVLLLSLLFSGGCASKSPNYYVLHSLQSQARGAPATEARNGPTIGVGPVKIPDYLDRPQMATRSTPSSLQFAEFDKWAEPLDKNVARILAENLSLLLATDRVLIFPWSGSIHVPYQVTVDLTRLDTTPDGKAVLVAAWSVFGKDGTKLLAMKRSSFTVPVQASGFDAMASAESRTVEEMSREIAAFLGSLPPDHDDPE